jgi:hypothetical protein
MASQNEELHSAIGAGVGATGGATLGWFVLDCICPGLGTLGALAGGAIGASDGAKDKCAGDNARTGLTAAGRMMGWYSS